MLTDWYHSTASWHLRRPALSCRNQSSGSGRPILVVSWFNLFVHLSLSLNPILSFWQLACYWLGAAYSDRDTSAFQRNARDRDSLRLNDVYFANYLVVSIARPYRIKPSKVWYPVISELAYIIHRRGRILFLHTVRHRPSPETSPGFPHRPRTRADWEEKDDIRSLSLSILLLTEMIMWASAAWSMLWEMFVIMNDLISLTPILRLGKLRKSHRRELKM